MLTRPNTVNPFSKREEFSPRSLAGYKFLTILSWLLLVVFSVYYTFAAPRDGQQHGAPHYRHNRTIFGQNGQNYTPFHLSALLTSIYWIALFTLQLGYVQRLFSADAPSVAAAANVGSHFIFHNLLTFGFVMLWCRGRFWWAELLLIVDFFNLNSLYFRHPRTPSFVHVPAVAGPLAWVYVALLWDGAAMVHASSLPARIIANVAIWGILLVGFFFLAAYRDYAVGFCFSFLMAGTHPSCQNLFEGWPVQGVLTLLVFRSTCARSDDDQVIRPAVDLRLGHLWRPWRRQLHHRHAWRAAPECAAEH